MICCPDAFNERTMPTKHSGFLKKSTFGHNGNFELAIASRRGGFAHFWRNNDAAGFPWSGPQLFGCSSVSAPSLLQNDEGPLEVFACSRGRIAVYTRISRWSTPKYFAFDVAGNAAVIQADGGQLHLVVPLAGGGFAHFKRSSNPGAAWEAMAGFGQNAGIAASVALIQSNFGDPGNLEIIAVMGTGPSSFLAHFWLDSSGLWSGPNVVPLASVPAGAVPTGVPAFLQSRHGLKGNFEAIVGLSTGGFAHITRDNDSPDLHWNSARTFGTGNFSAVSVLQSGFGAAGVGNFELAGCVDNRVEHYWCDDGALQWNGPTAVVYSEPAATTVTGGEWRIEYACEPVGIHAALLRTNKILFFSYHEHDQTHGVSSVFNPSDETVEHVHQDEDLFCAGHAFLPDGRLLVAGGHVTGEKSLFLFTPTGTSGTWEQLPDLPEGRWYPTCTALPDGTIFVLSGTKKSGGGSINDTYQIFHPALGLQPPQPAPFLNETAPYNTYPFVFLLPSGKLVIFSADRACLFDLATKTFGPERVFAKRGVARTYPLEGTGVLLPLQPDNDPPYRARVLVIGGGGLPEGRTTPATNTCEVLDLSDAALEWKPIAPMPATRVMPDAVLLPDGTVLVMNGSSAGQADDAASPVFQSELYDPKTNTWKSMAETRIPRLYHATALLLPDGTVMTAGMDEEFNPEPFHYPEYRIEVFYPPYLFRGPRPEIQAVPNTIHYGVPFQVQSDTPVDVYSAALLRCGAVTHSFNMDQRHVGLKIAARGVSTVTIESVPNANIAPPGYYLLFVLTADGVPSTGTFVKLE
jgi:hypothetical protein